MLEVIASYKAMQFHNPVTGRPNSRDEVCCSNLTG